MKPGKIFEKNGAAMESFAIGMPGMPWHGTAIFMAHAMYATYPRKDWHIFFQ